MHQAYIQTIISRIDFLNQQRIQRALAVMERQSQQVFSLIPTLFHYNSPLLPGYCDHPVPYGVYAYEESEPLKHFVDQVTLSQIEQIESTQHVDILGLYTMGSTASIGQNTSSDLDIWVCVSSKMEAEALEYLNNKCQLITEWAKNHGVEASFFIMDEERFRNNHSEEMTGDNCGSSQHMLLLDEFYRSAVRLAGQRLLWQIVPPEMEECYQEYTTQLCHSGKIDPKEWIDFGGVNRIPAEEYFGSNLWQLYKSIDSPYKSVLKAILLEAYSWEYPNTQLLSVESKRIFFAYEPCFYSMDSYHLILEKVTTYLKHINDFKRLDLVRRCFYLKTHEKLSHTHFSSTNDGAVWRRNILRELIDDWGWDKKVLKELDNQRNWKVEQVKRVHLDLLNTLMLSYRHLIQFARRNNIISTISPQDISILARKLYATFEVLPCKITLLNQQISPDLHEPDLSFIQVPEGRTNQSGWYLYKQPLITKKFIGSKALEHYEHLSKLVSWAFFNGLITESTRLHSVIKGADLDIDKLYQMVGDLRSAFSLRTHQPSMQALNRPCEVNQLAVFINFENDPSHTLSTRALKVNTKDVNIFSFGKGFKNLVGSVDLIYRNSWNEVRSMHFTGTTAILDALKTILGRMHQNAIPPNSVDVFCYSKHLRCIIKNTIHQLFIKCIKMRLKPIKGEARRRFKAIKIANQTYGLLFARQGVSIQKLDNSVEFYRNISINKLNRSPLSMLGKESDYHMPSVVDSFASEGLVQFFFEDTVNGFNIYVLDEENSIGVYHQVSGSKDETIMNVNRFYTSSDHSEIKDNHSINFNLPQYYQIVHPKDNAKESYIVPYRNDYLIQSKPSKAVST